MIRTWGSANDCIGGLQHFPTRYDGEGNFWCVRPSVRPSARPSVRPSVCLSVSLSLTLQFVLRR